VRVKLDKDAYMPVRAHQDDAGMDLRTPFDVTVLPNGCSAVIDTGVHMAIPAGYVGMIKSKSGLNMKQGIIADGTIDAGYTGSIKVKIYNLSDKPYHFKKCDKITQIVILPIPYVELEKLDELPETDRGEGGFGSTGR
jgi:dUTP pyrophosphatase